VEAPLSALIISYAFPPTGGAGVQRVTKLVKYLGRHGVRPSVLTVENPSVPLRDESLLADVPKDVEVVRVRTLEPGYQAKQAAWSAAADRRPSVRRRVVSGLTKLARQVLVPDAQVLWQPAAQRALAARLARRADDVVLVSGPPFSAFLLAPLARTRAAVVLDYRDEWSTYRTSYEMTSGGLTKVAGDVLEPLLLRCAHRVTTATEEFRSELLARYSFLDPRAVVAIPNGYDEADFDRALPEPSIDKFVMTYAGTIFTLTSPRGLLGAIRRLHAEEPALASLLAVRFLGRIVDTEQAAFAGLEELGVECRGYVPHTEVLPALAASQLTLVLLDDVPGASRIYPAKIFELARLGRPILALAPEGALTRLCREHQLGSVIAPRDEAAIAAFLAQSLRAFARASPSERKASGHAQGVGVGQFDRAYLAGRFAEVLREAAAARRT
jgi:glycosyltransferase involved in cell wall biosynthesis